MNAVGIPSQKPNSVVLRRPSAPGPQTRLNDRLVPWLRLESKLGLRVVMSLLAIGAKSGAGLPRQS
jgi:hypothetical protein